MSINSLGVTGSYPNIGANNSDIGAIIAAIDAKLGASQGMSVATESVTIDGEQSHTLTHSTDAATSRFGWMNIAVPGDGILIHGDTSLVDAFGNRVTGVGVDVDSGQSKFGSGSLLFSSGSYATIADSAGLEPAGDDFTAEAWIRPTSLSGTQVILSKRTTSSQYSSFHIAITGSELQVLGSITGTSWAFNFGGGTLTANAWQHVAVVRHGTALTLYLDGASVATRTITGSLIDNAYGWQIGGLTNGFSFGGHIDELRYVKSAVYVSAFSPPTAAFDNPSLIYENGRLGTEYSVMLHDGSGGNAATQTTFKNLTGSAITAKVGVLIP